MVFMRFIFFIMKCVCVVLAVSDWANFVYFG